MKKERIITEDKFSLAFLLAAAGMLFVYAFIQNPADYTISLIGTEHPALFFAVSLVMSIGTAVNMLRLEESSGVKNGFLTAVTYIVNIAMIAASFTQTVGYVKYITEIHWFCALLFMAVNPIIILICVAKRIKNGQRKSVNAFCAFMPVYLFDLIYILRSFTLYGALDGKNGIMEIVPIFTTFIILFLFNHTKTFDN